MKTQQAVFLIACLLAALLTNSMAVAGDKFKEKLGKAEEAARGRDDSASLNKLVDDYENILAQFPKHADANYVRWRLYRFSDDGTVDPAKRAGLASRMLLEIIDHSGIKSTEGSKAALKFAEYFSIFRNNGDESLKGLTKGESLLNELIKNAIAEKDLALEFNARWHLGQLLISRNRNSEGVKKILDVVKSAEELSDEAFQKTMKDDRFDDIGLLIFNGRSTAAGVLKKSNDAQVARVIRAFLVEHPNLEGNADLEKSVEDFDTREKRRPKAPKSDPSKAKNDSDKDLIKQRIEFAKRHPLRADPKLRVKLSIVHSDPELGFLLERLASATSLNFHVSDALAYHAPKYGEFNLKDVFAYSVMELIAERDLTHGCWVKTDDGYRLEGESRALRLPPRRVWPWVVSAITLVAIASAGVYRWRFKKSG